MRRDLLTIHRARCTGCSACESAAEARKDDDDGYDTGAAGRDYERYVQGSQL